MKKNNYFYVERETEKALLLTSSERNFWVPKSVAEIHPRYKFLAKPFSFFEPKMSEPFKRWKRKERECVAMIYTISAECRWCGGYFERWVEHDYEIGDKTSFSCPKCRCGFKPEELKKDVEFTEDVGHHIGNRGLDFIQSNSLLDYWTFCDPYITFNGQMKILDQDMRETGGYYKEGLGIKLGFLN